MEKITKMSLFLASLLMFGACGSQVKPPLPYGPVPTKSQIAWHEMEYFSLICYGLNTYTEQEWAYGDVDPKLFDPSDLDTDQWAKTARDAGMKGLILVAKHHDGFSLWPSKFTDYSVKATPWKNGTGDVLGDLSKSCKKYGLKLGVYLSPWDRNHAEYGRPEYVQFYYDQLEELLTEYGDVFEFWIDGANGGTGYYGGANERRSIDRRTYYGYDTIFSMVKKHQPGAVIFSDVGPGVRWVGNEAGIANETNWNTINTYGMFPGESDPEFHKKLGTGEPGGESWIPAEVNTTLLWPKAWYYHTGHQPRSLQNLMELYYTSIGRGSPLNLGIAIAPSGQIRDIDKKALLKFKKQVDREFSVNLVKNATIKSSDHRGSQDEYSPMNCVDGDKESYWATNDSVHTATLYIGFKKETTFNRLLLQENIRLGQRIHKFTLEIKTGKGWEKVANGTTIGYKRVLRFDDVTSKKARVTLETKAPCLTLSNLGIYNAPPLLLEPEMSVDIEGNIILQKTGDLSVYYALGDKPTASSYKKYTSPIQLPHGGKIHAYTKNVESDQKSDVVLQELGKKKKGWKVYDSKGGSTNDTQPSNAIDADIHSFWEATGKAGSSKPYLAIDLGKQTDVRGFAYTPPGKGIEGAIFEYEFYVSKDGKLWGEPISKGEFSNIENNPITQRITFNQVPKAKYIKLVSISTVKNSQKTVINEIELFVN